MWSCALTLFGDAQVKEHPGGRWAGSDCEPLHLCWSSGLIFVSGLTVFYIMQLVGEKLIEQNNQIEMLCEKKPMLIQEHELHDLDEASVRVAGDDGLELSPA